MSRPYSAELGATQEQYWQRWSDLRDPHVRALAWLLTSPPLLDASLSPLLAQSADLFAGANPPDDYLYRLDTDPSRLHHLLAASPGHRLGYYAELLFYQYLLDHSDWCRRGIQMRDEAGRTLGEFDFLLQRDGRIEHWELATKFYLWASPGRSEAQPGLNHFLGPNLNDRFGDKTAKMLESQLRLSQYPEYLQLKLPVVERTFAWMRGWLFYPPELANSLPQVEGVANQHGKGWILTISELAARFAGSGRILPRLEWLAPATCAEHELMPEAVLLVALNAHFQQNDAPALLAQMEVAGGSAYETARYMIVSDDWPGRAARLI